VDALDQVAWLESCEFTFAHRAAADIARRHHPRLSEQNRTTGQRSVVLRACAERSRGMADLESCDGSESRRHAPDDTPKLLGWRLQPQAGRLPLPKRLKNQALKQAFEALRFL